ncbi:MAG: VOC family protein [Pseudomonadota bacterium]
MADAAVFDHLIIPTLDLDASHAVFQRLGFSMSPRKTFPFGDARVQNHLIYMHGSYIELIQVVEGQIDFLSRVLAQRKGPAGLALRCAAAQSRRARAEALGFDVDVTEFDVNFTVDGVTYTGDFRASLFLSDAFPVSWMQLIEEIKPYDRSAFFLPHANTTDRLTKLVMVADDAALVSPIYEIGMDQTAPGATALRRWNDGIVDYAVTSLVEFTQRYGAAAPAALGAQPFIAAAHFCVDDVEAARSQLQHAGMPFTETDSALYVSASDGDGMAVVFEAG